MTLSEIQQMVDMHQTLDEAVLATCEWPLGITDEEILEMLLGLNLERAGAGV